MRDQNINTRITADIQPFSEEVNKAEAELQDLQSSVENLDTARADGLGETSRQIDQMGESASGTSERVQDLAQDAISNGLQAALGQLAGVIPLVGGVLAGLGGVAAGVGLALYNASQESVALENALTLTGHQAGVTTDQLVSMSNSAAEAAGATRTAGVAAMAEVVHAGGIAAGQMALVAEAALRLEDVGAQSLQATVREFSELGREPVAASLALTEKLNYLTAETYLQIKALEDQGLTADAAAVAQRAYGDALAEVAAEMEDSLGPVESAFSALGSAAALMWDKILNIGREDTLAEQLAEAKRQADEGVSFFERARGFLSGETVDPAMSVKALEAQIEAEERIAQAKRDQAEALAAQVAQSEALDQWNKEELRYLDSKAKLNLEIKKIREDGLKAKASEEEINGRILVAEARYANQVARESAKAERERIKTEREHLKALREREQAEVAAITLAERGLESLQAQVVRQREANEEIGLAGLALVGLKAGRLEDAAATNEQAAAAAALLGRTPAEIQAYKDKAVALRELAGLTRAGGAEREALAQEAARADAAAQAARAAEDAWRQSAQQIEQSLTDALLRGFESGKGFAETFRDTLQNMFQTLVLRPVIQAMVQPLAGGLAGMMAGGGGGAGGALGTASNLYSLASGAGSLLGLTGSGAAAGTVGMANLVGMAGGDALGALAASNSLGWGTSAAGVTGGGLMSGIGAALPWIGGGLAIASLLGAFDKKPSNKAAWGNVDLSSGALSNLGNMTGDKQASQQTMDARTLLLQQLGLVGGQLGARGNVGVDVGGRDGVQVNYDGVLRKYGSDVNAALRDVFTRMLADTEGVESEFRAMIASMVETAPDQIGGMLELVADGLSVLKDDGDLFAETQRALAQGFDALGARAPQTIDEFRALAAGLDLTTAAGRDAYAGLAGLAPVFGELARVVDGVFTAISQTTAQSVRDIELSILDSAGKYAYLDTEIDHLLGRLSEATLPDEIGQLFDDVNKNLMQAYSLLDGDEQQRLATQFIDRLYDAEAIAQSRLSVAPLDAAGADQAAAANAQREAAAEQRAAAAEQREAAAEARRAASELHAAMAALPNRIENVVRIVASETGY